MTPSELYEQDFYQWALAEAARIRALPETTPIDRDNVAEEIASLARRHKRKVETQIQVALSSLLRRILLGASREIDAQINHALFEVGNWFDPGMRADLRLDKCWSVALREIAIDFPDSDIAKQQPATCPLIADDFLVEDPDFHALARKVADHLKTSAS